MYYLLCTVYNVLHLGLGELPSYLLDPLVIGELGVCTLYMWCTMNFALCTVYSVLHLGLG